MLSSSIATVIAISSCCLLLLVATPLVVPVNCATTVSTSIRGVVIPPENHIVYEIGATIGSHQARALSSSSSFSSSSCPTSDKYSEACLQASIPPYPICLSKTVEEYVEQAIQGYNDCCIVSEDDMSTSCKCPQKNSQKFINKISDWCARAETCLDSSVTARMDFLNEESLNHGSSDDDNDDDNIWNKKSDRHAKWPSHKRKSSMLFKLGLVGLLLGIIAIRYVISYIGCCKDDDNDKEGGDNSNDETTLASTIGRNSGSMGNNVMNDDDDDDKTEAMSVVSDINE